MLESGGTHNGMPVASLPCSLLHLTGGRLSMYWFCEQVVKPFKQYVSEGAEPSLLAWSASTGFVAGLCPLLGKLLGLCDCASSVAPVMMHTSVTCVALTPAAMSS